MLEINTLYNETPYTHADYQLCLESFNNNRIQNDFQREAEDIADMFSLLNTSKIHTVYRQHKFVGFFYNVYNSINKDITFKMFLYPRACPMASRSIARCGTLKSMLIALSGVPGVSKFEFHTWHPSLLQAASMVIPLKITQITPSYLIGYAELTDIALQIASKTIERTVRVKDQDQFVVIM